MIPTARPKLIPISKSVNTIPSMVTIKGINWVKPRPHIFLKRDGFASL